MRKRPIAYSVRRLTPLAFLGSLVLLASCARTQTPPPEDAHYDPVGLWRATLALPGGELPFGLEFARDTKGALVAYLVNDPERVHVSAVTVNGNRVTLDMPGFQNKLTAQIDGDQLDGEVTMVRLRGALQRIPLHARRGEQYRFFKSAMQDGGNAQGRWSVVFKDDGGKTSPAVGEFQQDRSKVTGTFLTPTGDHRFLAGEVRGQELYLSGFDGGHAYLYRARFVGPDRIEGSFWSGLHSLETFVAVRDAAANLGSTTAVTQLKRRSERLAFEFPDLDGKPISLGDERFRNRVVLVTLAGSWCPNCHDEAAWLAPLYRRWRDRGFEVVSLMFERYGDFAQAATATRSFREEFGIEYPTPIAGTSDKDDAATRLPQLNGVFAFPTTIILGRDGTVRYIHTGFSGPATGAHYTALTADLESRIERLLSEPSR